LKTQGRAPSHLLFLLLCPHHHSASWQCQHPSNWLCSAPGPPEISEKLPHSVMAKCH
jgi:hypothetical protein